MASVNWSQKALDDVEAIAVYIARDSTIYASAIVQKIIDITRNLHQFPLSGRIVPELNDPSIREKLTDNYRIIYRCQDDVVTIITVIHGKKQLDQTELNN
ncbi:type II toxin-antitoxin system RelE/ParE family toxin [Spirulina sp. 06S082]|uniref:type II toxin-antitoxin system RelE/ParE family toxin n=1 Tax=Spirulina sp. 06S082 TaxID=3110248 RepID=UPI002B21FB26|nr:type II toxin-antitoxin system RelE/ParE family toxin [Spirulina sp. 06S082]MEA5469065.1 type II toxin-antitoxin system RelE/ParE family toxin [Spirulina sp. 06S082]